MLCGLGDAALNLEAVLAEHAADVGDLVDDLVHRATHCRGLLEGLINPALTGLESSPEPGVDTAQPSLLMPSSPMIMHKPPKATASGQLRTPASTATVSRAIPTTPAIRAAESMRRRVSLGIASR